MKRFSLVPLLALSLLLSSDAKPNDLIMISWSGTAFGVDSTTGQAQGIGVTGFSSLNSMGKAGGQYLALSGLELIQIDPLTGVGTSLGLLQGVTGSQATALAFDPLSGDGFLSIDGGNGGIDQLWRFSLSTLQATWVGPLGVQGLAGAAFDEAGQMYGYDLGPPLANGLGLIRISKTDASVTDVSATDSGNGNVQFLTFLPNGDLVGGRSQLFRIDPLTGVRTLIGAPSPPLDWRGAEYRGPVIVPPGSCHGIDYCVAQPNTTGQVAHLCMGDTISVATNQTRMFTSQVPANEFGFYIAGTQATFVVQPGGSFGNLCVGGQLVRFKDSLQLSGESGVLDYNLDLTDFPANPTVAVAPGETWFFQAWYRDHNPLSISNFSDAVEVTFHF